MLAKVFSVKRTTTEWSQYFLHLFLKKYGSIFSFYRIDGALTKKPEKAYTKKNGGENKSFWGRSIFPPFDFGLLGQRPHMVKAP